MKLISFNLDTCQQLLQSGFQHIEIRQTYPDVQLLDDDNKRLQILKAFPANRKPDNTKTILIESQEINALLSDRDVICLIIIDDNKI